MMKKKLNLILAFMIALTAFCLPAIAEEEIAEQVIVASDDYKVEILKDLGILPTEFADAETVTRIDFLRSICSAMSRETVSETAAFTLGKSIGATNAATYGDFNANNPITQPEAIKMLVAALGYGELAENTGGYPTGYMSIAYSNSIVKGSVGNGTLTTAMATDMLYKALDTQIFMAYSWDADSVKYIKSTESFIYYYRKLLKVEGIAANNTLTSLNNPDGGKSGITIGTNDYYSTEEIKDYLGYPVIAYVTEEDELVAITKDNSEYVEYLINESDIGKINDRFSGMTYFPEDEEEELEFEDVIDVVYNGRALPSYTAKDLIPENGYLKLIDNDKNEKIDVVFVTDYDIFVVEYSSAKSKLIHNKYKNTQLPTLELSGDNIKYSLTMDGEKFAIGSLKEWDIVETAVSKSGKDTLISGIVTRNVLTEKIVAIDNEIIVVGEGENQKNLELNPQYVAEKGMSAVVIGTNAMLCLDTRGRIAAVKSESGGFYAYVTKMAMDSSIGGAVQIKYIDENGEWSVSTLAPKVKCNTKSMSDVTAYDTLAPGGNFSRRLMRLKTNADGQVSTLLAPGYVTDGDDKFVESKTVSGYFYGQNQSIAWQAYVGSSTVVFSVPDDETVEDIEYKVGRSSLLRSGSQYSARIYNSDEFDCTELVLVMASDLNSTSGSGWFIVTKKEPAIGADGTPTHRLYSQVGNDETATIIAKDESIFADVHVGDIILYQMDGLNRVRYISKLHDSTQTPELVSADNFHGEGIITRGYFVSADPENGKIRLNVGKLVTYNVSSSRLIEIFDVEEKKITKGTIRDLKEGDYLIQRYTYSDLYNMVAIRY